MTTTEFIVISLIFGPFFILCAIVWVAVAIDEKKRKKKWEKKLSGEIAPESELERFAIALQKTTTLKEIERVIVNKVAIDGPSSDLTEILTEERNKEVENICSSQSSQVH